MIEQTILRYLKAKLDVPVDLELPEVPSEEYPEWPDRFVVVERVGGSSEDHIPSASFAFQTYSLTRLYDAAALDEEVRQAVEEMAALPEIGGVHLASNYNHTDTRTKRYRYQCVYDITHY